MISTSNKVAMGVGVAFAFFTCGFLHLVGCSSSLTPAKVAAAEAEFCDARAVYKLAAAAAGGALDPAADSPRAKLEAAEDRFCAAHDGDAGQ